jgi:pilus assembly protein Flp/PilA
MPGASQRHTSSTRLRQLRPASPTAIPKPKTQHWKKSMTQKISAIWVALMQNECGQDLIEYALVAGLLGLGAVVAMSGFSSAIGNAFNSVGNSLTNSV